MRPTVGCFTSFSLGELARARVLASTLRKVHPDWVLHGLLVDRLPPDLDGLPLAREFDQVVMADRLAIPGLQQWIFGRERVEACHAVQGQMLVEMLAEGFDQVVCLDAATVVLTPVGLGESASIVLTPRLASPGLVQDEVSVLQAGVFDPGFIAVRNDEVGRGFAHWWATRLHGGSPGAHWTDLVPALFDRVHIDRDLGANVNDGNADHRGLAFAGGTLTAGGRPVRLYRFDAGGAADGSIERHEMRRWYERQVAAHAVPGVPEGYWGYGTFPNGADIPSSLRALYRSRPDLAAEFPDPFDAAGLYEWAERE